MAREEVIADYKASAEFQSLLDDEYDANFPATFKDCWETIVEEIGRKIPEVTLEAYPVPLSSGQGPSGDEAQESARDSTLVPSPPRAVSEAVTSPLQEFVHLEGDPLIPHSTTADISAEGDKVDDGLDDLGF